MVARLNYTDTSIFIQLSVRSPISPYNYRYQIQYTWTKYSIEASEQMYYATNDNTTDISRRFLTMSLLLN